MLHLLKEYAEKNGLFAEPGFRTQRIQWAIEFDRTGKNPTILPIGDHAGKKLIGLEFARCPFVHYTADGRNKSQYLWETAAVMTLLETETDDVKTKDKHRYFVRLLRESSKVLPELNAIAVQLDDELSNQSIQKELREKGAKPHHKVTLRLDDGFMIERESIIQWWRNRFAEVSEEKQASVQRGTKGEAEEWMRCSVTGELTIPASTHPMIKGLGDKDLGGNAQVALTSFNAPSFCSYGLKQSANSAVSAEAASYYTAALDDLVNKHATKLVGVKVVHWYDRTVPNENDPIWLVNHGSPDGKGEELAAQHRAKELLESIKSGEMQYLHDKRFFALMVSGVQGRMMVRDWMEGRFEELVTNVRTWFGDLAITNLCGTLNAKSPRINNLITSMLPERKQGQEYKDWIKPVGAERLSLWRSAVRGDPVPISVIARIVKLHRDFCVTATLEEAQEQKKELPKVRSLLYARMALMKLYHIRKGEKTMSSSLNPNHPSPAYHCGRLLSMLARLQEISSEYKVKSGVVQRYYGAASTTPGLVLGRLTALSQHHLAKIAREKGDFAYNLNTEIAVVWDEIKDKVPSTLNLEEQSLFALGYYQQMAALRTKKSDNDNANDNE